MVMALADGKLAEPEKALIESLRERLGIDAETFRALCEEVRRDRSSVSLPEDRDQAQAALNVLIEMATADGRIQPAEQALLHHVGEYVGVDAPRVDQLADQALGASESERADIEAGVEEVYAQFESWDAATQARKVDALADRGRSAVVPLLRALESYRTPDGAANALAIKTLIARALGRLGDPRTVYYLCQQVNIGDADDEVTCAAFRFACAEAIGKIADEPFDASQAGVEAARQWWLSEASGRYDRLAF